MFKFPDPQTEVRAVLASLIDDPDRIDEIPSEDAPALLGELATIRARILQRMFIQERPGNADPAPEEDRMLDVEEAAEILGVKPKWVYRRSDSLPFARKLSPNTLRFSRAGLFEWLESQSNGKGGTHE